MAVISHQHGYLFLQAPKAASTAIGDLLRERHDGIRCPRSVIRDEEGSVLVRAKHATLSELIDGGVLDGDVAPGLFKFVSVRNPFDALVSMWTRAGERVREAEDDPDHWLNRTEGLLDARRRMSELDFTEWIESRFGNRKSATLYLEYAADMDAIVRFERLDEELALALGRVGVTHDQPVHKVNPTRGRSADYRSYYTPELRTIVEAAYAEEMDVFGYTFDGLVSQEPVDLTSR